MADSPRKTRRQLLSPHEATALLRQALQPPTPPPTNPSPGSHSGQHLLSVSREAMACLFEVVFDAATYRHATDVAVAALEEVARLESQLTVYRDTSEVSAINRRAADEPVVVEENLYELLKRGAELTRITNGAFEMTAGALSKIWGFYRRQGRMPAPTEIEQALATVGSHHLVFDDQGPSGPTIRFLRRGLELNLGAIGKGYALDRAAAVLQSGNINNFLLHGGQSSVLARGHRDPNVARSSAVEAASKPLAAEELASDTAGNPPGAQSCQARENGGSVAGQPPQTSAAAGAKEPQNPSEGWVVGLRHPLRPDVRLAEFILRDQALGTSGSGTQYFHYQGRRYGHILDPRTGWPAEQVLSATVIAPTAELADALSTACYVLGVEGTQALCNRLPQVQALLTVPSRIAGRIELIPIGLAEGSWRIVSPH